MEAGEFTLSVGADWINNVLESGAMGDYVTDTIEDRTAELKDYVAGYGFISHANARSTRAA